MKIRGLTSKLLHTPYLKEDVHHALQIPIYSNAAYEFANAEDMEMAFQGKRPDHQYSRISNPTVEHFEQKVKSVTGALAVTALSSGMAAIANVLVTVCQKGDVVITSPHLFGNTYSLLNVTLTGLGVQVIFADLTDLKRVEELLRAGARILFFETITNPQLEVVDIAALSSLCKKYNTLLVADSTITPPNVFNAKEFGVDIEVVSSTKIFSGGATSIGGIIIDNGTFNYEHIPALSSWFKKFGPFAFNARLRKEVFKNLGACMSPHTAYLQIIGIDTMVLRFNKATNNAFEIAEFLETKPEVQKVNYPGSKNSSYYTLATKQFTDRPTSILTFDLESKERCFRFLDCLKMIKRATNLYDTKSLMIHPASTIFNDFTIEQKKEMHISENTIRFSVGIEDLEDLKVDIEEALQGVKN
jgi:O-acetylhomoserine (thiol)-lyase